jgi:Tol biopolymer transport system component
MKTDNDLERQLRDLLRQTLDREPGPDPIWAESPAAHRITKPEPRRPSRWTIRVMAMAALITIGGGAALLLGAPDNPALGPNGWIAQSSGGDIYLLGLEQEVRRVVGTDGDGISDGCPAFSPDGRQLAYGRVAGEAEWVVDEDGAGSLEPGTYSDASLVIADVGDDGHVTEQFTVDIGDGLPPPCPVWAPSGDRIAFAVPLTSPGNPEQSAVGSEVRIVTLADGSVTVLPDLLATDLEFSPDGSLLAITSGTEAPAEYGRALEDGRIYLYEFAGGAVQTLDATLGALTITWSPDGGRMAYLTGELDPELRVIDLATGEQRVLDHPATLHGIGPVWSPDGESILYQRCDGAYGTCRGERHEVVLVWPDDLSADGTAREEAFTLFDQPTENTQRELYPYWVTWSPDGEQLLFSAWPANGRSLLGVTPAVAGGPADVLVSNGYPSEDPGNEAYVFWEPSLLTQTWGRRPAGMVTPETPGPSLPPTPTPSTSSGVDLPAGPHLVSEGIEGGVPITVTIAAPRWQGEPAAGALCRDDPVEACSVPPDGAGMIAFQGTEYRVWNDACHRAGVTVATTVDELVDALQRQVHRFAPPGRIEDITVDGYAGRKIVLRMVLPGFPWDCDDGIMALFGLAGDDLAGQVQGHRQTDELWVVDVDGLIVVLDGMYYVDTPDNAVDELRAMLGSATFE